MRLVTAEEMRQADRMAIEEYGVPGMVLMENAGQAVVQEAEKMLGGLDGKKAAIFWWWPVTYTIEAAMCASISWMTQKCSAEMHWPTIKF